VTTFALLLLASFLQTSTDPDMVEAGSYLEFNTVQLELRRTEINTYLRDLDQQIVQQIKEICQVC